MISKNIDDLAIVTNLGREIGMTTTEIDLQITGIIGILTINLETLTTMVELNDRGKSGGGTIRVMMIEIGGKLCPLFSNGNKNNRDRQHWNDKGPKMRHIFGTTVESPKEFLMNENPEFVDPSQPKFRLKI